MELDCGIAKRRIDAWLDDELVLDCDGECRVFRFAGEACVVSTHALEGRPLGSIELERTNLCVEGDTQAVEEFMRLFTLRFVSAGG